MIRYMIRCMLHAARLITFCWHRHILGGLVSSQGFTMSDSKETFEVPAKDDLRHSSVLGKEASSATQLKQMPAVFLPSPLEPSPQSMSDDAHPLMRFGGGPNRFQLHSDKHVFKGRHQFLHFDHTSATYAPMTDRHGIKTNQLFYELVGSGPRKVVMVMGLAGDHTEWLATCLALGDEFTVCVFDNRGIWYSMDKGVPDGRWRTTDMAADVNQLLDHLVTHDPGANPEHWNSQAHLVGASMGGMIAQEAALHRPERYSSLSLISTHAGGPRGTVPPPQGLLIFLKTFRSRNQIEMISNAMDLKFPGTYLDEGGDADGRWKIGNTVVTFREWVSLQLMVRQRKRVESVGGDGLDFDLLALLKQVGAVITHYISWDRLTHLRESGMTFLIVAGAQDCLISSANSKMLHEALGGELFWADDAGHCINEQHSDAVNEALVRNFDAGEANRVKRINRFAQDQQPAKPKKPSTHPYFAALGVLAVRSAAMKVLPARFVNAFAAVLLVIIAKTFAGGLRPNVWGMW